MLFPKQCKLQIILRCIVQMGACQTRAAFSVIVYVCVCSSGQDSYFYQLFIDKDDHVVLPTTQQLLELSFLQSNVKLSEVKLLSIVNY